jgi:uncharacterized protein (TIGR02118 family)
MITRIGMAPRRHGLTTAEFQRHWHDVHGPLVRKFEGLRRNWQNHAILRDGEPLLPWAGFDACSEMDFSDVAAMQLAFRADRYPPDLKVDSDYLIDKNKAAPMVAQRIHVSGTIDPRAVRLMTFMRSAPDCSERIGAALRTLPAASAAMARELYLSLGSAAGVAGLCGFDAVDVQWFDRPDSAERYLLSAEAREHRHALAHVVHGVERLIAQVRVVM